MVETEVKNGKNTSGFSIDLSIEKRKHLSKRRSLPNTVIRSPDFDLITEDLETDQVKAELGRVSSSSVAGKSQPAFRSALVGPAPQHMIRQQEIRRNEYIKYLEQCKDGMEGPRAGEPIDREEKVQGSTHLTNEAPMKQELMPQTDTVAHELEEQMKLSDEIENGLSSFEIEHLTELDQSKFESSYADRIWALKEVYTNTPLLFHYAQTEQQLVLERIDEEEADSKYWLVLLDDGGPVQDARMAEWIVEQDGTICSNWNRDLIIVAVKNDLDKFEVMISNRHERNTRDTVCSRWKICYVDQENASTRHKYICMADNDRVLLDMGRKGPSLRVNHMSDDANQKWLVSL